jgi:geranylgeranyl diphosphate synthase type I
MAYELIGSLEDTSQSLRILQTSALELQKVGFAQITDIHFGLSDFEPSEEEIIDLYKFKTARYSFSLPLRIGGMLAGYDDITLQNFESFGESLGIAFQIKDDELGIYGDEKIMGKPVGSDIRENKKTLFRHALFRSVDEAVRPELELIYGSKKLTEEDMTIIREYLKKHNVLSLVQKVREDKSIAAKNILNNIDIPQKYKLVFADLVDFSNDRDK